LPDRSLEGDPGATATKAVEKPRPTFTVQNAGKIPKRPGPKRIVQVE